MMYREEILDLYRNPRNEGELETEYHSEGENPSCGDSMEVFLEIEDGKIVDMKHETEGCAISTAAVSIVSEQLEGMEVGEVKDLDREWMLEKMGIDVSPMRVKCAMLGLETAREAIDKS